MNGFTRKFAVALAAVGLCFGLVQTSVATAPVAHHRTTIPEINREGWCIAYLSSLDPSTGTPAEACYSSVQDLMAEEDTLDSNGEHHLATLYIDANLQGERLLIYDARAGNGGCGVVDERADHMPHNPQGGPSIYQDSISSLKVIGKQCITGKWYKNADLGNSQPFQNASNSADYLPAGYYFTDCVVNHLSEEYNDSFSSFVLNNNGGGTGCPS